MKLNLIFKMRYNIAHGLVTAAQNTPTALRSTGGKPWREAASLILVSPSAPPKPEETENGEKTQVSQSQTENGRPHFLVTQRSKSSGTFSNILCFPGGNSCLADTTDKWVEYFGCATGFHIDENISFISARGERPTIYEAPLASPMKQQANSIPKEVSLRLTAIRETFEETGILLCKPRDVKYYNKGLGKDSKLGVGYEANLHEFEDSAEVNKWQSAVRRNPVMFMKMCDELMCTPDINALVEWSNWLTPNCFGMQRFDTIFYVALLPKTLPLYLCPDEVESASVSSLIRLMVTSHTFHDFIIHWIK